MIVSEKLHCKIPWVEELRFTCTYLSDLNNLFSKEFLDKAAHGTRMHTRLCWLEGGWQWIIKVLQPFSRYFTDW